MFAFEGDFGRAPEAGGRVDDAQGAQGAGVLAAGVPDAKRFQRGDGTREQRGRAVVVRLATDEDRGHAARGERDGGHQSGRPAAHDDDFGFVRHQFACLCFG
jgi:hypothetical protein